MSLGRLESDEIPSPDFDAFFTQYKRPLYAYLCRLLLSHETAAEVAQEAFFRAWQRFAEIQKYQSPEAWLYRVATNLAISALRRRQQVPLSQILSRPRTSDEQYELDEAHGPLFADTVDIEGQSAERDAIARALSQLAARERIALIMRASHGFSYEEVAEALGVSVTNARTILARARYHFRELYDAESE